MSAATTTVPTAKRGFFPLDEQLGVWDQQWSEAVAKQAVWLSGLVDFETAEEVMQEVGQIAISDSSIWRRVERWGEGFHKLEAGQSIQSGGRAAGKGRLANVLQSKGRMGVGMDGTMVNIREEGWKELKVGCVFEIEVRPSLDVQTKERVELGHAVRNSYVSHLGGPEAFGEKVWLEAERRGWTRASDSQVIGDGALWIWNLAQEHFYDSHQTVDWYHATEHLGLAAQWLHGEGTPEAKRWLPVLAGQARERMGNHPLSRSCGTGR